MFSPRYRKTMFWHLYWIYVALGLFWCYPRGKLADIAEELLNMTIEIVDLPSYKTVIFPSVFC